MFTGFGMNMLYPVIGISAPLSPTLMIITISGIVLILSVLCYVRDENFAFPHIINVRKEDYPLIFGLVLIPCMSVLGTYLMNVYHNNILLMIMIVVIALVALMIGFDRFIPAKFYPLAIFLLTLSLLLHTALISMNLWGWDIFYEYYLVNLVIENSIWNSTMHSNVNAMLSIVSLVPFISSICAMSPVWVLKIIYPFIFSFVPLGLFRAVQKQTNEKIAFFAMFFFISIFTFYNEMLTLARQQIAELFLVLTILLMIDKTMDRRKNLCLLLIFGASLIVSHYAVTWIYLFSLIAAWILLLLMEKPRIQAFEETICSKFRRYVHCYQENLNSVSMRLRTITFPYVLFFVAFTLLWYITFSGGSLIDSIITIGERIVTSISEDFVNPEAAQGLGIIVKTATSPLHTISKYLHLATIFFIILGILTIIINRNKLRFENEYFTFSLINFTICVAGVTVPFFASALNTSRLYHITLIFLAPFCIIGGLMVFSTIFRPFLKWNPYRMISIFFVIFLFFNTGLCDEIFAGGTTSVALDRKNLERSTDYPIFYEREISGAQWLSSMHNTRIYIDQTQYLSVWKAFGDADIRLIPVNTSEITDNSYIYLGMYNIMEKKHSN